MVISKCVPLEISRKKFSQFIELTEPNEAIFVGWKVIDGQKKNVQLRYEDIKGEIIDAIKADPEWGQGGSGGDTPESPDNPDGYVPVVVNDINAFPISPIHIPYSEGGTWDDENQTNIVNLQKKKGFVEINAGGDYTTDYIMLKNPVIGTVTNVVVDNTGLPTDTEPKSDKEFVLYYGMNKPDEDGNPLSYEILAVPPMCRGIVQILHTEETDVIIHSSYTYAVGLRYGEEQKTEYVPDMISEDEEIGDYGEIGYETNSPVDKTPTGTNANSFDIDMQNQRGYIEFQTRGEEEYTFWFSNPEFGTSTYIVIDNSGALYEGFPVSINYGKRMGEGTEDDWYY